MTSFRLIKTRVAELLPGKNYSHCLDRVMRPSVKCVEIGAAERCQRESARVSCNNAALKTRRTFLFLRVLGALVSLARRQHLRSRDRARAHDVRYTSLRQSPLR